MARPADFDLARELARPGFTPGQRDVEALIGLVIGDREDVSTRAAPALASLGPAARDAVLACLAAPDVSDETKRVRLVAVVGLLARAGDRPAREALIARVGDPEVRIRRAAIVALGKLGAAASQRARRNAVAVRDAGADTSPLVELRDDAPRRQGERRGETSAALVELRDGGDRRLEVPPDRRDAPQPSPRSDPGSDLADVRAVLIARWDSAEVTPEERRALAEALGKIGGAEAMERLESLGPVDDPELERRRQRALLVAEREANRADDSTIVIDAPPPRALAVRLGCRPGLAELLVAELAAHGIPARAPRTDAVDLELHAPWRSLYAARLWATGGIQVALPSTADRASAIVDAITGPLVRPLLHAWTRGPIRWRLAVAHGHQRALIWRVANLVRRAAPEMINDPTNTTWDLRLDIDGRALSIIPRRIDDPRFAYRVADVPASSHPTVAAAIVRLGEARSTDRVWDPFCGAGLELVERARLGPVASLIGSDVDPPALDAAARNIAAASVVATLVSADARTHDPGEVDLIVTNPPLGSRVHGDAAGLLVAALPNLARRLGRGGRLVWITPAWRKTSAAAEASGLRLARSFEVDLGGVRGRMERWDRR